MGFLSTLGSLMSGTQYIPYSTTAHIPAEIHVLTPTGEPYAPRNNVSVLTLQRNPSDFQYPERIAEYLETKAWGRQNATLQYSGGLVQEFDFTFPIIDHYTTGGPPHAHAYSDGTSSTGDFDSLIDVIAWANSLRTPIRGLRQPPSVRIVWGPNIEEGVIKAIRPKVTQMYADGYPMIAEIQLRIKPEPILVYTDRNKVSVP